jgi:hypothetical protein
VRSASASGGEQRELVCCLTAAKDEKRQVYEAEDKKNQTGHGQAWSRRKKCIISKRQSAEPVETCNHRQNQRAAGFQYGVTTHDMSLQYDELKQSYRSDSGKLICHANDAPTTIECAEYPVSLIVVVTPPPREI